MISIIFLLTTILVLWFNTEVFVEYISKLHLHHFITPVELYLLAKEQDCTLTFQSYLLKQYNCFFTRLITCPLCFNFWTSLMSIILFNLNISCFPMIYICSLLIYFIFNKLQE